jgi:glycosyltransferase involved in cell wall biosynthesis
MHNLLETQDVEKLGYTPGLLTKVIVHSVERLIAKRTVLIVPLPSQRDVARRKLSAHVESFVMPYAEAVSALDDESGSGNRIPDSEAGGTPRWQNVLLFGFWGPQKDLPGGLKILHEVIKGGIRLHVWVVGSVNTHFPEYATRFERVKQALPSQYFEFVGEVDEQKLSSYIRRADLVFLPYMATGGYSAALNVAAGFDAQIVAYDLPALREFSGLIEADCTFIDPLDIEQSARTIAMMLLSIKKEGRGPNSSARRRMRSSEETTKLIARLRDGGPPNR